MPDIRYTIIYMGKQDDGSGTMKWYKKKSLAWYQRRIASNGKQL